MWSEFFNVLMHAMAHYIFHAVLIKPHPQTSLKIVSQGQIQDLIL